MYRLPKFIINLAALSMTAMFLVACGGGGTDNASSVVTGGSGTVGLFVTDNPITDGTIKAACVTYQKVEVLGDGRYTVYQGQPRTFDLLQLRDHARPLAFGDVPTGVYEKIRLTLVNDGIELKLDNDTGCDVPSRTSAYPKLPGNNKLDFVVKGGIVVQPGSSEYLEIDMDAEKAIHIVETGKNCNSNSANKNDVMEVNGTCTQFNFRSVVFVRALNKEFTGKLIRVVGTIESVNREDRSFQLCNALPGMEDSGAQTDPMTRCIRVRVSPDDSFFNAAGSPQPLADIQSAVGEQVTVNGRLWRVIKPEIPDGYQPRPGECRIWDPALPADQQSLPGACEDLWDNVQPGQYLISGDDNDYYPLVLDALTIGVGSTTLINGMVDSSPVPVSGSQDEQFGMEVGRPSPIDVVLQAGVTGGNGTRIIDQMGNPLTSAALFPPRPVKVDGVVVDSSSVLGELVVLLDDPAGLVGTTRMSGTIGSVATDGSAFVLVMDPADPDNTKVDPTLSDQSVAVPLEAKILLVDLSTGSSESLAREQLTRAAGKYINLYAVKPTSGLGDWLADTIVVIISGSSSP
jgi:hypothetical protein